MDSYNRQHPRSGSSLRRTSYASVAAGAAATAPQNPYPPPPRTVSYSPHDASPPEYGTPAIIHPPRGREATNRRPSGTQVSSSLGYGGSGGGSSGFGGMGCGVAGSGSGGQGFGLADMPAPPALIIPSYLQGSRYAERLEEAHRARVNAHKEAMVSANTRSAHSSNPGSLSTSSSSANLPKMVPSHRGMTHEIIERTAPPPLLSGAGEEQAAVQPLPTRWSDSDKHKVIEIRLDGLEAAYTAANQLKTGSQSEEACAVRSDHPMPRAAGIYYWECSVHAKKKEVLIGIGFCSAKAMLARLPGWEEESWAYHGDDGHIFSSHTQGKPYGNEPHKFGPTDTVGCGVNFRTGQAFFTKNGVYLGIAFSNIRIDKLYPVVGMKEVGETIRVNFGQKPFIFDIDAHVRREREKVHDEILRANVSKLNPPLNEKSLVQKLIAQYLSLDGFVDTAHAFAAEVRKESQLLATGHSNAKIVASVSAPEKDPDAIKRQRIRAAVLRGDIEAALKLMKLHYERVLKDNENIYFKLRCRKYVEMIRKVDEQRHQAFANESPAQMPITQTSLPHPSFGEDFNDVFGHGMELDDQLQLSISGVTNENTNSSEGSNGFTSAANGADKMDTDAPPPASNGVSGDAVSPTAPVTEEEVIRYGTQLQLDFKDDPRREVKRVLEDTLALIAYENPRDSPLAYLLDESARGPVAEELNSAILVSLGKAASSGLERLVQQVEVLVDELAEDGGVGTMVNVRRDYLR